MELNQNAQKLYDMLFTREFDIERLKVELDSGAYSADDVNLAALQYVDDCMWNLADMEIPEDSCECDYCIPRAFGEIVPGQESSHMLEAVAVLLEYGLDPNKIYRKYYTPDHYSEYNIMSELAWISNGYLAADTLVLLLEHGGNPNLFVDGDNLEGEAAFRLQLDLFEMKDRATYDALVHYWMVLVGYGAKLKDGSEPVDRCQNFDTANLKKHRNYYYGAIHSDRSEDHMEICIFDKLSNWEVARY